MKIASVLVPVTGDSIDKQIVKLACELLETNRSNVYILYVIEVGRSVPLDADVAPAASKGEEVLKDMEQVARRYKCNLEAELVQARKVGAAVVQEAVDKAVDTIVLGVPYQERFGSYSLGESIPYILKHAPCRVIVSREPNHKT
ncbi:universal stress protein [Dehalococcoidia bacterium]|nr:universal stress protein [Dehalococcoidia bacterium]